MTAATFPPHDKIAATPRGAVLICAEPTTGQLMPAGHRIPLPQGTWLRVKFESGGLWCEAVIDGAVRTVVVNPEDFGALEVKPTSPSP